MAKTLQIRFAKLHGLSNDFIVADADGLPHGLTPLARAICERRTGLGADGFLVVFPPKGKSNDARVRFLNADGSEAEMSGNGIRCVGAYLLDRKQSKRTLRIETAAGVKTLELVMARPEKWTFRVGMGKPVFDPRKIPFKGAKSPSPVVCFPLQTHRGVLPVTVTSMGNPHCTVFVAGFATIDWARLGREIETNRLFPHRTNVEFVRVVSRKAIEVRFWERGVGGTMSSGTGSCAAAVASILNRRTGRKVQVRTPSGRLEVAWPAGKEVTLIGPVELVAQGAYHYRGQD